MAAEFDQISETPLIKVAGSENAVLDVIFVHGLSGDANATWQCPTDNVFWPKWLHDENSDIAIYTFGYSASIFAKWAKKEMDIFERAANTLEIMAGMGLGQRPIAFISHSLGGILVKILLRKASTSADPDFKNIVTSTKLVTFLSTPHTGSSLANIIQVLPVKSSHIALLANDTGFLEDLKNSYKTMTEERSDLVTVTYYEKFKTKKLALVVDRASGDPGASRSDPIAVEKDHFNICKPSNKDDIVYLGIKRHLSNLLKTLPLVHNTKIDEEDSYTTPSDSDRRTLLEKLIDANREKEYSIANEGQNKFARKLTKIGLFSKARDDYDLLLDTTRQRFLLHVYMPLICKGAKEIVINDAIQNKIIDPIAGLKMGESIFKPQDILNALYYLTEQCHIRWEAPNE